MDASSHSRDFPCRFCQAPLSTTFVDLGMSPLCQTHISQDQLNQMEPFYPLHAYVCDDCFLVQLRSTSLPTRSSPSTRTSPRTLELGRARASLRRDR